MVMDITIDGETRDGESFDWPDGAVINLSGFGLKASYDEDCYAIYSKEKGWTAFNIDENFSGEHFSIQYSEYFYVQNESKRVYPKDYFPTDKPLYHSSNTNGTKASGKVKEGVFYVKAVLYPMTGRVRFVSDTNIEVEYNHAKISLGGTSIFSAYERDELKFHLKEDGLYYSDYVYVEAIPELKIGNYVFRYKGEVGIEGGKSGIIRLPNSHVSDDTWECEEYFEIIHDENVNIILDGFSEDKYLYNLYTLKHVSAPDNISENDKIKSNIGLTVSIDYTINSFEGDIDDQLITLWAQSSTYYEGDSYNIYEQYYHGNGFVWIEYYEFEKIGERKTCSIHSCCGRSASKYSVFLEGDRSIWEDNIVHYATCVNMTIHKITISNF